MAYFNHAFGKAFYLLAFKDNPAQTSANLTTAGDFGVLNGAYKQVASANVGTQAAGFYLAQGSFMANDTIGNNPGHGGYKESTKSKMIKYKYISDMWITDCNSETAGKHVTEISPFIGRVAAGAATGAQSCFPCGSDPIMRVDIDGTAALRLLNHNAYQSLSGSLPMPNAAARAQATFPTSGVDMCCLPQNATSATVGNSGIAPSIVAINFRDQFNNDPILSKLGTAKVFANRTAAPTLFYEVTAGSAFEQQVYIGGARGVMWVANNVGALDTVIAVAAVPVVADAFFSDNKYRLVIELKTSCELQTQFSSCSFDTRDFYLMGGLKPLASLQDEAGVPCVACQGYVEEATVASTGIASGATNPVNLDFLQRRTSSETGINDILMTENYRQSPYNQGNRDSSRMRQQEGMSGIVDLLGRDATSSSCAGHFKVYHMLHNVPRFNNPSGTFDNDQYHYRVYTKCSGGVDIDNEWLAIAMAAEVTNLEGSGIVTSVTELKAKGGTPVA